MLCKYGRCNYIFDDMVFFDLLIKRSFRLAAPAVPRNFQKARILSKNISETSLTFGPRLP